MPVDPNFLVIGAARAGTTTLHHCLADHPDVLVPKEKQPEPHFFYKDREFAKGVEAYRERCFAHWRGEKAVGEVSASTLFSEKAARRVADMYPAMRLVCSFREPVERAYSNYWHSVRNGVETLSFEEAVTTETTRLAELEGEWREIAPFAYLGRSEYGPQLEAWLRYFPIDQFHFLLFEDLVRDPSSVARDLFRFLGVDPDVPAPSAERVSNRSTPAEKTLDPALRARLVAHFHASNELLSRLIGRDLHEWGRTT